MQLNRRNTDSIFFGNVGPRGRYLLMDLAPIAPAGKGVFV